MIDITFSGLLSSLFSSPSTALQPVTDNTTEREPRTANRSPSDEELLELTDNREIVLKNNVPTPLSNRSGETGTITGIGTIDNSQIYSHNKNIMSRIDSKEVASSSINNKSSLLQHTNNNSKNHQIVAIQAGLIEVDVSKDEQAGAHKLPSFTKFCLCTTDHKTGMLPIVWTCVVVLLALIFPIFSFAADIFIYIEGNGISHRLYWWSRSDTIDSLIQKDMAEIKNIKIPETSSDYNDACLSAYEALLWQKQEKFNNNESLKAYQHNLSALFQPCLIIGTVLSVGLSIFLRLVMLGCGHRNFRSAITAVFIYSLMPMLTTVVIILNGTYLTGPDGFICKNCVLEHLDKAEDISSISSIDNKCRQKTPLRDDTTLSIIFSLFWKAIDGIGSGIILFIVLCRGKFRSHGHNHFWISLARCISIVISLFLLLCLVPLLYTVPAGWYIYLYYLKLLVPFPGIWQTIDLKTGLKLNEKIFIEYDMKRWSDEAIVFYQYLRYVLLSGSAVWLLIVVTAVCYFSYKSWLFYRFSE